jgi:predicted dehydrogenase
MDEDRQTRTLLVGLGTFGSGWYQQLKRRHSGLRVATVDSDAARGAEITSTNDAFYTSLSEAIEQEEPDFIINATPPHIHTRVNRVAFDHRLPVLCEKPIAEAYEEGIEVVRRATEEGIPFMVAENYRRFPIMRKVRQLLQEGVIGALQSLHCDVYRTFYTEKAYFLQMRNPFLVDVVVHHLDLIRFFTSSEGRAIYARNFQPEGSWHPGNLALSLALEMENGVAATLVGSLTTRGVETPWSGNWRLEGSEGTILVSENRAQVTRSKESRVIEDFSDVSQEDALDDFLRLLRGEEGVETVGTDYLKTQALVHFAEKSSELNQVASIALPAL